MEPSSSSLLNPWEELGAESAETFLHETLAELSPGHGLPGIRLTAIARSRLTDDVLFQLDDSRVADVHFIWSGGAEKPPWPRHRAYDSVKVWGERVMVPSHKEQT